MPDLKELLQPYAHNYELGLYPVLVKTEDKGLHVIGEANSVPEAESVGICHWITCEKVSLAEAFDAHFWLLH